MAYNKNQTCAKQQKCDSLQEPKPDSLRCETSDVISKLSASQATKKCVGGSTWDAFLYQMKPAMNEKRIRTLC